MTTRKNFGGGVTDASLLIPNTAGGVLNVVPNTLQGVKNSGNTAANVIKSMSSRIVDAFSHKPFDYEKLQAYAAGDGFMKKRKTAFGNAWKGIKNTPRYVGNVTKQLLGGTLATVVYGTGMLVGAPIGAAATFVKNTTQSVAGAIVDPMNSILKVGQQGADDKGLAFTKVEKSNTVSYTDYAKRITDNRALKKAKRAEKRAAIAAINAKYDGKSLAPKQPEAKKEEPAPEKPAPVPEKKLDTEKKKQTPKTYSGLVSKTPQPHQVFVFGSNQNGAHGGGNAKFAAEFWGAKDGEPEGLQGQAYGIVTTIKQPDPSNPGEFVNTPNKPNEIIDQIKKLYTYAKNNSDQEFLIGYTEKGGPDGKGKSDEPMLSGYSPSELAGLFWEAAGGAIPSNIVFNDKFSELVNSGKKKA